MAKVFRKAENKLFGQPQVFGQLSPAFEYLQGRFPGAFSDIQNLGTELSPIGTNVFNKAYDFATSPTDQTSENNLWNMELNRFREATLPTLAARGLATSGPGINAEFQGTQDLAAQFADKAFGRNLQRQQLLQQAQQGLAVLKSLPIQLQQALMATILGTPINQPQLGSSLFQQLFGTQGLGGVASLGGTIAGSSSLAGLGAA